jgi:MFS family permease
MFLIGVGNAAALLSRYAAADAVPVSRRASAMSAVVWAGTVGAAGGPFLMAPSQSLAVWVGLPALSGPFLLALAAVFSALLASTHIRAVQPTDERLLDHRGQSPRITSYVGRPGRRRDGGRAVGDGCADERRTRSHPPPR